METYPRAAVERVMKVQEVIMRAMAKKITWKQAGEMVASFPRPADVISIKNPTRPGMISEP